MNKRNRNIQYPMSNIQCSTGGGVVWIAALACALAVSAFAAETVTYSYDDAGRLTNAAYSGGGNVAYAYDANGNLLLRTVTAAGGTTYTLVYLAGAGGTISGIATQIVAAGGSGAPVQAAGADTSVVFGAWSDGRGENPRTDTNVTADLTVAAGFESAGGAALDWYANHGFAPEGDELWSDLDARIAAGKGTTLLQEYVADTDPNDTGDVFRVLSISNGPPLTVQFQPGSTGRVYTFQYTEDLDLPDNWTNVPGVPPRNGAGGTDGMADPNVPGARRIYRVQVQVP